MEDNDIIKQLEYLKEIKPKDDWANFARKNLLDHIEAQDQEEQWVPKWLNYRNAVALASFAVVGMFMVGVFFAGDADNRKGNYTASESTEKQRAELVEAFNEFHAEKQATSTEQQNDKTTEKQNNQKAEKNKNNADNEENGTTKEQDNKNTKENNTTTENNNKMTKEKEQVFTSILNDNDPWGELASVTKENLENCKNGTLKDEARKLMEEGGQQGLIEAFEISFRCEDAEE